MLLLIRWHWIIYYTSNYFKHKNGMFVMDKTLFFVEDAFKTTEG